MGSLQEGDKQEKHTKAHNFFFQAEDGIRDGTVTGVQTCALPILTFVIPPSPRVLVERLRKRRTETEAELSRSEERRVGKECISQRKGQESKKIIRVTNKYAFLQITRRRFLNEWEAFKKVISRRNIRRLIIFFFKQKTAYEMEL